MGKHVHVGRAHDEAAAVFLDNRERLARTRFFHNRVLPAARLRAVSIVRTARGAHHVIAHKASTRIGHAHGAMHERFDFQIVGNAFAHTSDIGKAHFARHNNAAHA